RKRNAGIPDFALRAPSGLRSKKLRELILLQLAGDGERQIGFVDEFHQAGNFVGGEFAPAVGDEVGFGDALARLAHDKRRDHLVAPRVGYAGDAGELDRRMRHQGLLDLDRRDVDAGGLDHLLDAAAEVEAALLIEHAEVAGDEITVRVERGAVLVLVFIITDGDVAVDADLADFAGRERPAAL